MKTLSNVRVRNVATIGGCLAHGDPHMDLPPVMIALGASVTVMGPDGERVVALEDLYEGYYETSLAANELIVSLSVPLQNCYPGGVSKSDDARRRRLAGFRCRRRIDGRGGCDVAMRRSW